MMMAERWRWMKIKNCQQLPAYWRSEFKIILYLLTKYLHHAGIRKLSEWVKMLWYKNCLKCKLCFFNPCQGILCPIIKLHHLDCSLPEKFLWYSVSHTSSFWWGEELKSALALFFFKFSLFLSSSSLRMSSSRLLNALRDAGWTCKEYELCSSKLHTLEISKKLY